MTCRFCHSSKLQFLKYITYTKTVGISYTYIAACSSCNKRFAFKCDDEMYERLKNIEFIPSKSYRKYIGTTAKKEELPLFQ